MMIRRTLLTAAAAVLALAACDTAPTAARAADAQPAFNSSPLTVTISGPSQVPEGVPCTWIAEASGGVPPYEYAWVSTYLEDATSFSPYGDYTVDFSAWDGPDFVRVTVRDAADQEVQLGKGVMVSNSASSC